jgi:hypothetical protein
VSLIDITNYLSQLTKKDGDFISYGALRMHKATIVRTVSLVDDLKPPSTAEEAALQSLID